MIEVTLAGFKRLIHPTQVKAYASFGWKPVVETPVVEAVKAKPVKKGTKK